MKFFWFSSGERKETKKKNIMHNVSEFLLRRNFLNIFIDTHNRSIKTKYTKDLSPPKMDPFSYTPANPVPSVISPMYAAMTIYCRLESNVYTQIIMEERINFIVNGVKK